MANADSITVTGVNSSGEVITAGNRPASATTPTQATRTPVIRPMRPKVAIRPIDRHTRYLNAIFYGSPGVGKTTLAGSAIDVPEMRDVIVIDAEGGTLSISNRPGIDVVPITEWAHVADIVRFLNLHCRLRDDAGGDAEAKLLDIQRQYMGDAFDDRVRKYRTVIFDSLTEGQKLIMYQLLGITPGSMQLEDEPDTPEWKQWGQSSEMTRAVVRELRNLPMHVLIVCAERISEDDRKRRFRAPDLPGKLAKEIQGFVDLVGWMTTGTVDEKTVRRLNLQPKPTYDAKNRIPGFEEPYLDNPTMKDLHKRLIA